MNMNMGSGTGDIEMDGEGHDGDNHQRVVRRSHSIATDGITANHHIDNSNSIMEGSPEVMRDDDTLEVATNVSLSTDHTSILNPVTSDVAIRADASPQLFPSDECKFDPTAAGTSKSRSRLPSTDHDERGSGSGSEQPTMIEGNSKSSEFDPEAASASKSRESSRKILESSMSPAQRLGLLGSQQHGLYLLLHSDDIHSSLDMTNALRTLFLSHPQHSVRSLDSISSKFANLFHTQDIGDLIVWGTQELMDELGPVLSICWKDGDPTACTRFGALIIEKAKILSRFGMVVSIKTRGELCKEIRCSAVQEFLNLMSGSCDALCRLVSVGLGAEETDSDVDSEDRESDGDMRMKGGVNSASSRVVINAITNANTMINGGSRSLFTMLRSDLKLPRRLASSWHDLLLTLLAVPNFKAALANAYVDTYNVVTAEYAHGIGIFEKSSYTLSVQFLVSFCIFEFT